MEIKAKINNITNNFYSDEWYTDKETVRLCISKLNIEKGKTVLCPFDSENSEFVKVLRETNEVIFGIRDFIEKETNYYECDYIITNPPFSIKDDVIEKCIEYRKPTLLILPLDSLGGVRRHSLYKTTKIGVYIPTRRVKFYDESLKLRAGANFHSIFLMLNLSKNSIQFEYQL